MAVMQPPACIRFVRYCLKVVKHADTLFDKIFKKTTDCKERDLPFLTTNPAHGIMDMQLDRLML